MWRLKIGEGANDPYLKSTNNFVGRQTWEFDPNYGTAIEEVEEGRRNFYNNRFQVKACRDLIWRLQFLREKKFKQTIAPVKVGDDEEITHETVTAALKRAVNFLTALQSDHGHWPAEIVGPQFFLPPLVFCLYITGHLNSIFGPEHRKEILRSIFNHQNEDGGWGLHLEGHSTMFCTALNYICLRILGVGPDEGDDNACPKARKWILDHGSVTHIPSWGKTWLSILGILDWSGCKPMPPEFWIFPSFFPFHPAKMWCYCRLIYMPMSYLYGKRFVGPITPLIKQLREELHNQPFDQICWRNIRNLCANEDLYYSRSSIQNMIWDTLYFMGEPLLTLWPLNKLLRKKALEVTMDHIHYEDEMSRYITIGCVEKVLCMLACWVEDPNGDYFKKHLARIPDYIWIAEDGLKMQSFGSQTWDCGLSTQALLASNLSLDEIGNALKKAHYFIKESQVKENPLGDFKSMYRHISKGSWTFSDQDHGWQLSDCTAEGLKCALMLSIMPSEIVGNKMDPQQLFDSVNLLLSLQSKNGGLAAWEPANAPKWLEFLNPIEFLVDIVIEHEYVENTGSVMQALALFTKLYPNHRKKEIKDLMAKAVQYLEQSQCPNGGWYGEWGVCFIYSTWWALGGLAAAGKTYTNCVAVQKAVQFLLSTQNPDGGWGESYLSCARKSRDGFLDGVDNADILKDLAEGPLQKARRYDVCYVNGYRFHTISHSAKKKSSENSGVCVKSDDNSPDEADFYGKLEDIVDLEYRALPNKRVALFKCQWFDQTTTGYGHGTRVHPRYKLVDVHIGRFYRKYDPFVLASQASQVYYLPYPSLRQNMKDWRAVCKVRSKQFEDTAFQLEERSTDFVANEDVSDLQVAPLRDPAGELLHLDETVHDDEENEDTDDEDLVLSDDDEVDGDYVTQ